MSNIIKYLKKQNDDNDEVYACMLGALKAFDTGLLLMYLYSNEDIEHSRTQGDLPEGAQPLEIALRHADMASHTGGEFAEPWYIAQKLREVATALDQVGAQRYGSKLRAERMQSHDINVTDSNIQRLPEYRLRLTALQTLLAEYTLEVDPSVMEKGTVSAAEFIQRAIDLGVQVVTVTNDEEVVAAFNELGQSIFDDMSALEARIDRIERIDGLAVLSEDDAEDLDGFADSEHAGDPLPGAAVEEDDDKPLFSS